MKKRALIIIIFLFAINIFAYIEIYRISREEGIRLYFIDVGQGDATLIKTPSNHRVLIDGGPGPSILNSLSNKIPYYDKRIDLILLTHPHSDHLKGLIDVIENYEVGSIIWTGVEEDTNDFRRWEEIISKRENVFIVNAGMRVYLGETTLDILYPIEKLEGKSFRDCNNTSIVSIVNYKDNRAIFTGDAYKDIERRLISIEEECNSGNRVLLCSFYNLDVDILQVGHHGSRTSTSEEFLEALSPEIAVISSGKNNRYGHPHEETLANLNNFDIRIMRTDKIGTIKIVGDGDKLKIY